jgi:hypothetical protein
MQTEWPFKDQENTAVFSTVGVIKLISPSAEFAMTRMAHGNSWVAGWLPWPTPWLSHSKKSSPQTPLYSNWLTCH